MANLIIEEVNDGVVFGVKVVPGASKTEICGSHGDMLKVRVSAAPEKGKANKCLSEHLAKILGIKKNGVNVISGHTSPIKRIEVSGISKDALLEKLHLSGLGDG